MFVQTENTPNPNSLKFLSEKVISDIGSEDPFAVGKPAAFDVFFWAYNLAKRRKFFKVFICSEFADIMFKYDISIE